ncbi:septum site-determining protein MinC [Pseudoalteromonas luteoviolacea]|uniref:Probable septum site-determining protein MinC n=1 Tax=Pseudoalteromonas luteoviolacea TaxID=43657 RepID=A0A1C0TJ55_9GAMM|nr:septum site-determining protein MinC [Pseudoalteromonas luteoviolacea]MBQ4810516.1 septum site-determining protein MinC [Pseudoalteromonas luteoviolacea]OCQ18302.1 septum site-determining protein MinC [Pseudoalteromonas luteoviolacea]
MSTQSFELKGNLFTLSVLQLLNADLNVVKEQLSEKISQAPKFFKGAPIVINLAEVQEEPLVLTDLKSILSDLSLNPVGICNGSEEHNEKAKSIGMSVLNYTKDVAPAVKTQTMTEVVEKQVYVPAQIVNGTVRSGQQIYAKDRDLIVIGAVSHGAEVIADGNIHIYGTLRGRAIAGAQGNDNASIFCQKLEAELVSVNGSYWISDSLQGEFWGNPCQITQTNESLELTALVKG